MLPYTIVLAGLGALILLTAWLPMVLRRMPLSLPIFCIAAGAGLSFLPGVPRLTLSTPFELALVERASEFVVIIALMGAGLKLDRQVGWGRWILTWRLLGIAMPLTIAALAVVGWSMLGLGVASALLLAAALAPTDPVLASDVQVGPPSEGGEDETRFALTSEAGLNDGLSFPFVLLAIGLATEGWGPRQFGEWALVAVAWKLSAGVAIGFIVGRALGWLTFHLPVRSRLSRSGAGFVALGITCFAYGVTELAHGYGFLAVFVSALALRGTERDHDFHRKLHDFMEELERLLMMVLLVMLGAAVAAGGLLAGLTFGGVVFALLAIFVVRPVTGWLSLVGSGRPWSERAVISFFGIRGLGTIYYLAYALGHASFANPGLILATASVTILLSVLLHGVTVTPILAMLDRRSGRDTETAQLEFKLET
ncbi:cation:proton antiporter [uncultured Enterovirga sp.]|uniref:cation:proton antiporter n=1 Tax=uncultured Enterovirga sp. TaxID=2026352 RepID=UPI0035C960C5